MSDLIAFMAKYGAYTMYYHQDVKHPDQKQFREKMVKELKDNTKRKHWKLELMKYVPTGTMILYSIWSMKQKIDILFGRVIR